MNRPTIVSLPPVSPVNNAATTLSTSTPATAAAAAAPTSTTTTTTPTTSMYHNQDANAVLDAYIRRGTSSVSGQRQVLDPVQFLNHHYPTEASLSGHLSDLREAVSNRMQLLDERISSALQRQSETAATTRLNVQSAKAAIQTLTERIYLLQQKAAQSEQAVLSITADMKTLDMSKRHLQRTITTLKRLHMLVHAVEELRLLAAHKQPDFKTASQLVQAIRILSSHFDVYTNKVPPLQKLTATVNSIQAELQRQVIQAFRRTALGVEQLRRIDQQLQSKHKSADSVIAVEDDTSSFMLVTPEVMRGGVLFLDALGDTVRKQFIDNLAKDLLRAYIEEFKPPPAPEPEVKKPEKRISSFKVVQQTENPEPEPPKKCYLDSVEHRFLWFRKLLEDEVQPKFGQIFPKEWNVQATLARTFLDITKQHFYLLLSNKGPKAETPNASVLVKALQKTLVFEKEITGWLVRECQTEFVPKDDTKQSQSKTQEDASKDNDSHEEEDNDPKKKNSLQPLLGVASVAFENFMGPYIALEEQAMSEQLAQALEDRTVDNRGDLPVFISSTNLFVYIKGSITRCTALTKGKPFFQLFQAFSEALRKYASILNAKLPKATPNAPLPGISIAGLGGGGKSTGTAGNTGSGSGEEDSYKLPPGEEVTVCHVISTCEYCTDTVEALEELIRDTIEHRQYKTKINMMANQEAFHEITAKSVRVLVSGLTNRTQDVALKQLLSTNWGTWESVGEESAYVNTIHQELESFFITAKSLLPISYFRSFCDKFAASFTSLYYDHVVRLKRVNEPGSQQLLLDVYNLKTLFLRLPVLEESDVKRGVPKKQGSSIAPAMYTKLVQKQFGRIETLLKLVGTPVELLIDNFKSIGYGTATELHIVMNLKGIKRPEQVTLLEQFGLDPVTALKGATMGISSTSIVTERVQSVTSDLNQMRQKVDDFRKSLRT